MNFIISESKTLQYLYFIEKYPVLIKFYCEISLTEIEKYIIEDDGTDKLNVVTREDIDFSTTFDFLRNIFFNNQNLIEKIYEVGDIKAACRITSFFRSEILQKDLYNLIKYLILNISKDINFSKNKICFESQNYIFLRDLRNISIHEENSLKASKKGIRNRILKLVEKFIKDKESSSSFSFSKYYSRGKNTINTENENLNFGEYTWLIVSIVNMINMILTLIDEFSTNLKKSAKSVFKENDFELINLIEDFGIVKKDFDKMNKNFLTDCLNKIFTKDIKPTLESIICSYSSKFSINHKLEELILEIKFNIGNTNYKNSWKSI